MTVTRQWSYTTGTTVAGGYSLAIPDALVAGDVYVAVDIGNYNLTSEHATALSGLGVTTWTRVTSAQQVASDVWVGVGASDLAGGQSLTVTAPTLGAGVRRGLIIWCFRGVTATISATLASATSSTATTADTTIGAGQAALAFGYSDAAADALKDLVPSGWNTISTYTLYTTVRFAAFSSRVPSSSETHRASASRASGLAQVTLLTLGDLDSPLSGSWGSIPIL